MFTSIFVVLQAVNSRQQQAAFNMQSYNQQQLQQQQHQLISAQLRSQFMKTDPNTIKNVGNQLGALQAAHQQAAAAANKVVQGSMNQGALNLRSHMGPAGHAGAVGMPQQAATPGPTYSPTPIQRPQGECPND